MKKFLIFFLLFFCIVCNAQNIEKYDTIIDMNYYKAYYNKEIQSSSFVIYKLYKGGGDVPRVNMTFKEYDNLPHFQYAHSGYDRGHLVAAEDYAYSKDMMLSTFYYVNCVPQTVRLNRGSWKKYETEVRKASQIDSLLIICGGCDYTGPNRLIPTKCFKIVYNLRNHRCLYTLLFTNDSIGNVSTENKQKKKYTFKKTLKLYNER